MLRDATKWVLSHNFLMPCLSARKFVFCYHDVSTPQASFHSPEFYSHEPAIFSAQIEFLSRIFEWRPLEELVHPSPHRRHQAALTFDDGFRSVRDVALPILEAKGIPFSVFVCQTAVERNFLPVTTALLLYRNRHSPLAQELDRCARDEGLPGFVPFPLTLRQQEWLIHRLPDLLQASVLDEQIYMTEADLRFLQSRGVKIHSHSTTHRVLARCDARTLTHEIDVNKSFLASTFGSDGQYFALPYGKKEHYDEAALSKLRDAGVNYVFTTNPTCFANRDLDEGRWLLPRISFSNDHSLRRMLFYINRCFLRAIDL